MTNLFGFTSLPEVMQVDKDMADKIGAEVPAPVGVEVLTDLTWPPKEQGR